MNPTHIILLKEGFATFEMPNEKDFSGDQWKENDAYKRAITNAIPFAEEERYKVDNFIFEFFHPENNLAYPIPNKTKIEIKGGFAYLKAESAK